MNRRGVDCSGFVYRTYSDKLETELPRTTELQAKLGVPARWDQLQAGDLVFFKTSHKVRHVGMYLEKGRFLHVSTRRGVMISSLDHGYWRDHYWMARRLAY